MGNTRRTRARKYRGRRPKGPTVKIDCSEIIRDAKGEPFREMKRDPLGRPIDTTDTPALVTPDGRVMWQPDQQPAYDEPLTVGELLFRLAEMTDKEKHGSQRRAAFRIQQKVSSAEGYVEFSDDEIAMLTARLDDSDFTNFAYGRVLDALDKAKAAAVDEADAGATPATDDEDGALEPKRRK